jgi:hypothetical protein
MLTGTRWSERLPDLVDVPEWGRAEVRLSITLITGSVSVRGPMGPLPEGESLRIGRLQERGWRGPARYQVDADGRVHITAPPGTLVFSLDDGPNWPDPVRSQVQWTLGGPQPAMVEVVEEPETGPPRH